MVDKAHRGKGIETELMSVLLVEIDKLKVDSFLTVYPKNPPAIAIGIVVSCILSIFTLPLLMVLVGLV